MNTRFKKYCLFSTLPVVSKQSNTTMLAAVIVTGMFLWSSVCMSVHLRLENILNTPCDLKKKKLSQTLNYSEFSYQKSMPL